MNSLQTLSFFWENASDLLYIGPFLLGFGGSKTSSKPVDVTPTIFKSLREPFADVLKQLFGASSGDALAGVPQSGFAGQTAPIGGNEQAILDQLMSSSGPNAQAQQLLSETLGGNFLPGTPGGNPYLSETIAAAQRPTFQGLVDALQRGLPGRFTQAGQFVQPQGSSAFDTQARLAARDAGQTAADIASKISFAGHEAERGRQQDAIQLSQQDVDTSIKNLQAQALPRLIQELGIERGVQEFNTRLEAILKALAVSTGAPLTAIGNTSSSKTSPNIVGTILGGAGIFSDRTAKTDIERVGKDPESGLTAYAFRYKKDPKTYPKVVGFMAQEVEKKFPAAIRMFGRKRVIGA